MRLERFDHFRDKVADARWDVAVCPAQRREEPDIRVDVDAARVGTEHVNGVLFDGGSLLFTRDQARIAAANQPIAYAVSVVRRGQAIIHSAGRDLTLRPGDVCLTPGATPFAKRLSPTYDEVLFIAPHSDVGVRLGGSPERPPSVVNGRDGFGRVLALHLATLVERASSSAAAADDLASATHHMVGAVFGGHDHASTHEMQRLTLRAHHRERVLEVIARRFADPTLDAETIARECRISVRYLHSLFAGEESVMSRLMSHRLEHCRKALAAAHLGIPRPSIGEIAYSAGFKNLAHFCRVFKDRYGMTASQARVDQSAG